MNIVGKKFVLNKARDKFTDTPLDRELRRKGERLTIINYNGINSPLVYTYDRGGFVGTSLIQEMTHRNGALKVITMNTYYEFLEVWYETILYRWRRYSIIKTYHR